MNEKFTRWTVLFLQYLKRDWKKILVWVLGLGLFCSAYVPAFEEIAKGQGLVGMYETMQNPAMISMVGPTPVAEAADYTIGAMYANEMLLFCGLFAMIIAALHVVSHTRKEEELGLTELVRSFRVGRQANSLAVMLEVVLINGLLGAVIAGTMTVFKVDSITVEGAWLFGFSIALAGIAGGGIALVTAQLMPTASGATGASLGIIGLLYIVRAGTDVSNLDLSMWNPMGWIYLTYPFTKNHWLPLAFSLIFSVIVVFGAFVLEEKRDMGAGYLPEREGRGMAKPGLLSVKGLLLHLNRGTMIAWLLTFIVLGAAYGSIYGDMQSFLESNELMKQMFAQTGSSIEASFTSTIMMVMMSLAAILPIAVVNKLFSEESRQHLSQLLATKVSRGQLYWTTILLAAAAGILGILFSAGGLGVTALSVMNQNASLSFLDFLAAGYNFLPTVLFFIGLAAAALGWLPRAGKAVYAYLGYAFALNYFGNILDLPDWVGKTAIQSWVPHMPVEDFDGIVFLIITGISLLLLWVGYLGYRQRDFIESN